MNTCHKRNITKVRTFSYNPDEENNHHQVAVPEQEYKKSFTGTRFLEVNKVNTLNEAYQQIVYWCKNVFMMAAGAAGEKLLDL